MVLFHSDLKPRESRCFYPGVMNYARETVFVGVGFDDYFKYKKKMPYLLTKQRDFPKQKQDGYKSCI